MYRPEILSSKVTHLPQHYIQRYIGRFAPSPTGPLHYGSLVAAVASYLQARANNGYWFIRIENIDPLREQKGSIGAILQTLHDFEFFSDRKPILQINRIKQHKHHALRLLNSGLAYVCECSRKQLATVCRSGHMGPIYPGICKNKSLPFENNTNIRMRVEPGYTQYDDAVYGPQSIDLCNESGDYVIFRSDQLPSYILAVTLDDVYEKYTEVVRGHDLLAITARQIYLAHKLGHTSPKFMHIPIIVNDSGEKLSKQTHAPALKKYHARSLLFQSLVDLGQTPPKNLPWRPLWTIWDWAIRNWRPQNIPAVAAIPMRL